MKRSKFGVLYKMGSSIDHCFVEWKEQFVSKERGHRVVHYFLKDVSGESILAVVGTERSVRHMFYVVSDEFLEAYAAEDSVYSGFRWRSRREVVNWLTSMLSKQHLQSDFSSMFYQISFRLMKYLCQLALYVIICHVMRLILTYVKLAFLIFYVMKLLFKFSQLCTIKLHLG